MIATKKKENKIMELNSDKGRTALALLITKVWEDKELADKFKKNPYIVLKNEGIDIPADVKIKVFQNSETVKYIPMTETFDLKNDRDKIVSFFSYILPIPDGKEVRLVQSSEKTYYIVIPVPPDQKLRSTLSNMQLMNVALGGGFQTTYQYTTQTLQAETTQTAVAETTEAGVAETSAAVVAEGVIVLC